MKWKSVFLFEFPTVAWMLLIFMASSIHATSLPTSIFSFDKVIHFSVFFVFGVLLIRSFHLRGLLSHHPLWFTVLASLITALYGIIDELYQGQVPGRTMDYWDALADAAGGIAGAVTALKARWILR